jgi:RND family efflux transporter MFP subunit
MPPSLKATILRPSFIVSASVVIALAAVVGTYVYTMPKNGGSYVHPTAGTIVQEVDASGAVKAADSVDLSFQTAGRIAYVSAKVGSHVGAGTTLASLDAADLQASVAQAKAALQVQQAKLDALNAGTRPEDIAVAQTAVNGAQSSLGQATQSELSAAQSAYTTSDDAVRNKADQFFNNPHSSSPTLVFTLSNSQLQNSIQSDRLAMETMLNDWQTALSAVPASSSDDQLASVTLLSKNDLAKVQAYLDEAASGLTQVVPNTSYPPSVISGYQSTVATARTNVSAAITALNTATAARTSAVNALSTAQSNLTLAQAPATAQDLEAQTAQVAAAQANVDAADAQLAKASIRAPFNGTVTVNNAHIGQTVQAISLAGQPLISMISDAQFQFETYVSQTDLGKIAVGNTAQITLDAYQSGGSLPAHVVAVDPAATVQNGVASYKVTLQFDTNDSRVLSGETGNARIITQSKQNALTVPTSAVITRGNETFVLKKTGGADVLTPVQIGIASASGTTEILSGVAEADSIESFGNAQ